MPPLPSYDPSFGPAYIRRSCKGLAARMRRGETLAGTNWKSAVNSVVIFGLLALLFTIMGIYFGPAPAQVGGTRSAETIPGHLAELAAFGFLLGLGSTFTYGRRGLPLVFLVPVLSVLLDVDHLPAYIGFSQPIRPAHSLIFLAAVLAVTAIIIKAPAIELVIMSAFMGHLAVDTGLFSPLSPLNFAYVELDPYRVIFGAGAVISALAAGVVLRRSGSRAVGDAHA